MFRRHLQLVIAAFLLLPVPAHAVTVPANFVVENAVSGSAFVVPTGMAFLPDGRLLVAEKRGTVWMVQNGARLANAVWSSQAEVLDNGDRGLLDVGVYTVSCAAMTRKSFVVSLIPMLAMCAVKPDGSD